MNSIYNFYKDHIKMSVYGTRCALREQLGISNDDEITCEEADARKEIREQLDKIDEIINNGMAKIDDLELPEVEQATIRAMDQLRYDLQYIVSKVRADLDAVMTQEIITKRLLEQARKKQAMMESARNMQQMKDAVHPSTLTGSPADFNRAGTVKIDNNQIKPVNE